MADVAAVNGDSGTPDALFAMHLAFVPPYVRATLGVMGSAHGSARLGSDMVGSGIPLLPRLGAV